MQFERMSWECLAEKVTQGQRPEGGEGAAMWIPREEHSG